LRGGVLEGGKEMKYFYWKLWYVVFAILNGMAFGAGITKQPPLATINAIVCIICFVSWFYYERKK
jgi:lipoprotein signal peptidase